MVVGSKSRSVLDSYMGVHNIYILGQWSGLRTSKPRSVSDSSIVVHNIF